MNKLPFIRVKKNLLKMIEFNPLKYFTFKRFINVLKIIISYRVSVFTKKTIVWGMPVSYSIEPTNLCNLKCPECPSGLGTLTRPKGLMKIGFFKEIIDGIADTGFYIQLYFQGEPYLNKHLSEMIDYAHSKNIYVSVSTNGSFITEKNIDSIMSNVPDKLIFSIDGLDEKTYQVYRKGGTFKQANEGLRLLIDRKQKLKKKKPFVELQFIVMKHNEHQIEDLFAYGKALKVDRVLLKTVQISNPANIDSYLPSNEKYRRYNIKDGKLILKNKIKNQCFALWRTSVITWDGKVVPCCFDKDAVYQIDSLNGKPFNEIWNSEKYNSFRVKILENRRGIVMCSNCTEGMNMNITQIEN